ncbi:MAG TPA: hypothetical protein VJT49_20435, partial [Amycolatopsis sp.]|uniref:hypothetical protein n=1 Tax=Amycolatopsis sp. TaxID=37632 RepID=UPI002B460F34
MTAPQPPRTYGDGQKTADQIQALPPEQQRAYFETQMSPQARQDYFNDQYGGNLPWFLGAPGRAMATVATNKYGQDSIEQATTSNTRYVTGLTPSNSDYKGVDHPTLQSYVQAVDPGQVGGMSDGYHEMASTFNEIATALKDAVTKSQSEWEGDAADSARGYFTSLQTWADGNSQNSQLASEVTYQQSTAAQTAKNSMPDPIPFSWQDELKKWASNPFDIVDSVKSSMEKQQQSQEAHDQAAQVMSSYDSNLYGAASKQPVFAEPPKFEAGGSGGTGSITGSIGSTATSGYQGSTGEAGNVPGGAGHSGGSGGAGGGAGSVSGALGGLPGAGAGARGSSLEAGARTGSFGRGAGNTSAQGFQPSSNFSPSSSNNNPNAMSTMGGMPMAPMMGGMGGFDGGDEYSSKVGRGGGFGPGGSSGSATGSGSAAGSVVGEGARTGLRAGGAGAAEAAGA